MRLKFCLLLLFLICSASFADPIDVFCPDPAEIKKGALYSWLPLYKEGEELASAADVKKFQEHIQKFEMARWDATFLETGHCFYSGDDPITDKIILAKDTWQPLSTTNWNWLNSKAAECRANVSNECGFVATDYLK